MPLETLELPRDLVVAARSYAAREHTSIVAKLQKGIAA